jgi:hypothetical protein
LTGHTTEVHPVINPTAINPTAINPTNICLKFMLPLLILISFEPKVPL